MGKKLLCQCVHFIDKEEVGKKRRKVLPFGGGDGGGFFGGNLGGMPPGMGGGGGNAGGNIFGAPGFPGFIGGQGIGGYQAMGLGNCCIYPIKTIHAVKTLQQ